MPTSLWMPLNVSMLVNFLALAGLVFSPYTDLPVTQDITKSFFIGKSVIIVDKISI